MNEQYARKLYQALVLLSALACLPSTAAPPITSISSKERAISVTHSVNGMIRVDSWKTLRDQQIVKQDLDYSCGSAALATLLNAYYGQSLTEATLLRAMDKGDGRASFDDMARVLPQFGFKAQGFAATWQQLKKLRKPVIVYIRQRHENHFSVLRGISDETVWLADPAYGNRSYSRQQFLSMWTTRGDKPDAELVGKFLAISPGTASIDTETDYFTRQPARQTMLAAHLANRAKAPWLGR